MCSGRDSVEFVKNTAGVLKVSTLKNIGVVMF